MQQRWELFQNCNKKKKKKRKNSILLQKDRMLLLQTCAGTHMDRHFHKHKHKVCTVQIFIIIYPMSSFIDASDLKSTYCMCHLYLLQQICTAPKQRDEDTSRILLYISELEQFNYSHNKNRNSLWEDIQTFSFSRTTSTTL